MNRDGFEEIITEYLKLVYNFVYRFVGDQAMAEDITQETFVKVWKNLKKFNQKQNFKTWIFTVARNTAIDWLRKKRNITFSELDRNLEEGKISFEENIVNLEPLPDEVFEKKELVQKLEKILSQIHPDFREIIILHHTEEMTFEEVARIVGKPVNTVKSQYRRALHQIRNLIRI